MDGPWTNTSDNQAWRLEKEKMRACVYASIVGVALGHGALYIPSPRNSQDNVLPQFEGGRSFVTLSVLGVQQQELETTHEWQGDS